MQQKASLALLFFLYLGGFAFSQNRTLEDYLKIGLTNNPLVKDYENQLKANSADSLLYKASLRPQLSADGKILISPTIAGSAYDENIVNPREYTAVGAVTQDIIPGKARSLQYRSIMINGKLIRVAYGFSLRDLRKNIINQYIAAYSHYSELQFADSTYNLLSRFQEVLKPMVQKGIYKVSDFLSFNIETQSQKIQAGQLRYQYKTDLDSLNMLCGISDTTVYVLAPPSLSRQITEPSMSLPGYYSRKFLTDSLRISTDRGLINLKYQPHFSWFADAGLNSMHLNTLNKNLGTSFGVGLTIPISGRVARKYEFLKLDLAEETRRNYLRYYQSQYSIRITQLKQNLTLNRNLIDEYFTQLKLAEGLIQLSGKELNSGEMSVVEFLNSYRSYKDIFYLWKGALLKESELLNELNYLNGY